MSDRIEKLAKDRAAAERVAIGGAVDEMLLPIGSVQREALLDLFQACASRNYHAGALAGRVEAQTTRSPQVEGEA